jgi:lipid-A-disaccharide synthase
VLIVAGEASADLHGSHLVKALKGLQPDVAFWGIGGSHMAQAGVRILVSSSDMAVVGLTEVVQRLHTIVRAARTIKSVLKQIRPDLLILIDYPEFNLYLARIARSLQIPVFYYISPQVWAWRRGRVKKIAKRVDRMAVILPFEEAFYRDRGLEVVYVGHPLLDEVNSAQRRESSCVNGSRLQGAVSAHDPIVGLLPGSREEEIRNLLPVMIQAIEILRPRYPRIGCLLPLAKTITHSDIDGFLRGSQAPIKVVEEDIYGALNCCRVVLVASGTATLDVAIMGVPMVVLYKVSPLSYWLGKKLIKVPFISLVNLIAGEQVVPELIQGDVTPERLADAALSLIEVEKTRLTMIKKLKKVRMDLGEGGASEKAASIAIEMMA